MIIDKVLDFWTAEDEAETARLTEEITRLSKKVARDNGENEAEVSKLETLVDERIAVREAAEDRYKKSFSRTPSRLYDDVKEIIAGVEKEDFVKANHNLLEQIARVELEDPQAVEGNFLWDELKRATAENYINCCGYIQGVIRVQEDALKTYYKDHTKVEARLRKMIEGQVSKWYVRPEPAYLPMAHGKPFDAFAFMSSKGADINRIGSATVERQDVKLVIDRFTDLKATLGVNTDKLLSTALTVFTQNNDFRNKNKDRIDRQVAIPLKDYARKLGYDVDEHETDSPEEAEKEKKRAKNALDDARKKIKKDLDILFSCSLSWSETIKGKQGDFAKLRILTGVAIKKGVIHLSFTPEIAEYLAMRNLITQYPTALLKLDARKPNAYYIGRKLSEHYYIDNNQKKGTYNRIGVKTLLEVTDLPTYEEVAKKDRRAHWVERIKEPFENALDELTGALISDWKYTHAKGVDLTEEEAYTITDYPDFEALYIDFELIEPEDQTDRIEEKDRRREELRKRSAQRKRKKAQDA